MFSKSKINEPGPNQPSDDDSVSLPDAPVGGSGDFSAAPVATGAKPSPSILSSDLIVTGSMKTTGDIQIEGTVEGDIRAHLLTIGEGATVKGECLADDVVVNGRVIGRVRGIKVRLTSTARVEGDIIHKTIAIESGAHFEGSVQRQEDPIQSGGAATKLPTAKLTNDKPASSKS